MSYGHLWLGHMLIECTCAYLITQQCEQAVRTDLHSNCERKWEQRVAGTRELVSFPNLLFANIR